MRNASNIFATSEGGVVRDELVERHGHVAVDLDASIERAVHRPQQGPVRTAAVVVDVPVNVQAALFAPVRPGHHRIVAERDVLAAGVDLEQRVHAFEKAGQVGFAHPLPIVVAHDEALPAFETPEVFLGGLLVPEDKVAYDVDGVGIRDARVPVGDEGLVHLLDDREGTVAELYDVGVA